MAKELHIAISLLGTDRGQSGIGHYTRSLLPILAREIQRLGGRITAIGSRREFEAYAEALRQYQISTHEVRALPPSLEAAWHLLRMGPLANSLGADCLLLLAGNRRLAARSPIPSIAVVHDLAQLSVAKKYDTLRSFYVTRVLKRVLMDVDRIVAVSGATRDQVVDALELHPRDVEVVYNGIDHDRFSTVPHESERPLASVGVRGPYILYSSRLEHPGKNHARLMRAYAQSHLAQTHQLVFAGKDWGAEAYLRELASDLAIVDRVQFLGYVADDVLPTLVRGASAVAMVGLCEGFGLPAVEALACGTPLIASNTGALPEVTGGLAVLCDPYSVDEIAGALEDAVGSRATRSRAELLGPEWAARFSWERAGQKLVALCEGACRP